MEPPEMGQDGQAEPHTCRTCPDKHRLGVCEPQEELEGEEAAQSPAQTRR